MLICGKRWFIYLIFMLLLMDSFQYRIELNDTYALLNENQFQDESNCLKKTELSKIIETTTKFSEKQKEELTHLIQDISTKQYENIIQNIDEKFNELTKKKIIKKGTDLKPQIYDEHFYCQQNCTNAFRDCHEAMLKGYKKDGVYLIHIPESGLPPFYAYCVNHWIVIQRRQDGLENFYRDWNDYKNGFGNIYGDHWLGLEKIHAITESADQELWVFLGAFDEIDKSVYHSTFSVSNELDGYRLTLSGYRGDIEDSMALNNGQKFSTYDNDNDKGTWNCARIYKGAWWYNACSASNLNGQFYSYANRKTHYGIYWKSWRGYNESLKIVQMALKPHF